MDPSLNPATWPRSPASITGLQVIPTAVLAVVRIDYLARHVKYFPVSFNLKAGMAYSFWWVTSGTGLAKDPVNNADAFGGSLGYQFAGGVSLLLDNFEPSLARQLDASQGINHTYAFFEVYYSDMGAIGPRKQLNLGSLAWTAGLALEF